MKILLDTCIIIDVLQNRAPFYNDGRSLFIHDALNHFEGFITANSVADIYYLIHQFNHSDEETRKTLDIIFALFKIIDTTSIDCRKALFSLSHDYEDAIMVETAMRYGCDVIITRNTDDYKNAPITIYTPAQFIKILENQKYDDSL